MSQLLRSAWTAAKWSGLLAGVVATLWVLVVGLTGWGLGRESSQTPFVLVAAGAMLWGARLRDPGGSHGRRRWWRRCGSAWQESPTRPDPFAVVVHEWTAAGAMVDEPWRAKAGERSG